MEAADFFPENIVLDNDCPILVTGGAGFIGSSLIECLLANGFKVRCFDNFSTGFRSNIETFFANPGFELMEADLRDVDACREAVKGVKYVFHEAALGSVPRSIADPATSVTVNTAGTVNLLDAARSAGVKRVVYASSSSVYGDDKSAEKQEDKTGKVLSPYAASKAACELFAANFNAVYGLECVGLRYFNVFGKRQNPDGAYAAVIPKFAKLLLEHDTPVINGDGTISRDFTFIGNVVYANILAMAAPQAAGKVFNVGCGRSFDLNELFARLRDALAKFDPEIARIEAIHGAPRKGDILYSLASIGRAKNVLGYQPKYTFEEGIEVTAAYYASLQ